MSEIDYNPEGLTEDQIRIKLFEEQAAAQAQELSRTIDRLNAKTTRVSELNEQKSKAFEVIETAVADGDIEADAEWLAEIGEIFGWEMKRDVKVDFTITGTAVVSLPFGKSLDDFSFGS
ncbi:MAG: hypothetical protein ACR2IJ_07420, partial [Fluviibacter sp.]